LNDPKDRLTFSAWPPRVDGTGKGVDKAFLLALAVVALLALMVVVSALRPGTSVNPIVELVGFLRRP